MTKVSIPLLHVLALGFSLTGACAEPETVGRVDTFDENETMALTGGTSPVALPEPPFVRMKIAVLRVYFNDQTAPESWARPEDVYRSIFDPTAASVNAYYREASYGKVTVDGTVAENIFGWYRIDRPAPPCGIDPESDLTPFIRAADRDVDFSRGYTHVMLVSAAPDNCNIGGVTDIRAGVIRTDEGSFSVRRLWLRAPHVTFPFYPAHELGHTLDLEHASFEDCGPRSHRRTKTDACTLSNYGDRYDVMGYRVNGTDSSRREMGHMNAIRKEWLGWFEPGQVVTADVPGTYTIGPLETKSPGEVKAVRVPRGAQDSNLYLYIEYRQPIGFDRVLNSQGENVFSGALLRTNEPFSRLLDPSPPGDAKSAALTDWYLDRVGNYVRKVNQTAERLTVEVIPYTHFFRTYAPLPSDTVVGTLDLIVGFAHPEILTKAEFFLDQDFWTTPAAAPYLSFSWPSAQLHMTKNVAGLSDGAHYVKLRVTDLKGNVSGTVVPFVVGH